MDLNIGIVVTGGIVVLVASYFVFKPDLIKFTAKGRQDKAKDTESEGDLSPGSLPQDDKTDEKPTPTWKIRRKIMQNIRALRKRTRLPEQDSHDEGLTPVEESPTVLEEEIPEVADDFIPETRTIAPPSLSDIEIPDIEPVMEEAEVNMIDILPAEIERTFPDTEQVIWEEIGAEVPAILPEETAEITSEQPQAKSDLSALEPAQEDTAGNNDEPKKEKSGNDVFSLFTDEVLEESDAGKLAATLNNVDVHALLEEAENIKKYIRRS